MKKRYQKPNLFAESFELMEHVAGSCYTTDQNPYPATYRDGDACTYTDPGKGGTGFTMFSGNNSACVSAMEQISFDELSFGSLEEFLITMGCYHAFMDPAGNAFAS